MVFEGFPLIIGWELTLECNMCCTHCGSSAGSKRLEELTTQEAVMLCDQFPDLLVQEVDFTGGEPLLRKDWMIIARHLADLNIPVNVLTNGIAIDSEMIKKLKECNVGGVGLSIDGTEAVHDRLRNYKGSYKKVLDAVKLLENAEIESNIITTVSAENIGCLSEMNEEFKDIGVKFWRLQPLIPIGRALEYNESELNGKDLLALGQFIRQQEKCSGEGYPEIICSDGLEYVKDAKSESRPWRGCPGGIISCGIMSDGRVKGCLSLPDEVCEGNIRERSLWDIWFDPKSFEYTRKFSPEDAGPLCRSCDKISECRGGCSSSSYAATGVFHNDPSCFFRAENNRGS